jgi:succinate dehydrogenase / fumarate reductase cytochrome b subunit
LVGSGAPATIVRVPTEPSLRPRTDSSRTMIPFLKSNIAAKLGMAVTGLLLVGFLIGHLSGNFLIFAGQDAINTYAAFLKKNLGLLWGARIGLVVMFVVHILLAIQVKRSHASARPIGYAFERTVQASRASRTMILSGVVILVYVLFHLAHFTLGVVDPETYHLVETMPDGAKRHDVFNMVVHEFSSVPIVAIYFVGMVLVGMHLSHSLKSMLQTLRAAQFRVGASRRVGDATLLGWLLAVGLHDSIPAAVLLGIVKATAGVRS